MKLVNLNRDEQCQYTQSSTFAIHTSQRTDLKLQKSLSVSTADFADTKKTKSFKSEKNRMTELKNLKPLTDKNAQLVTSGIKHWGLSGYANILPRIKFSVTRQESSPQSPTFHTANRFNSNRSYKLEDGI
jgi:hypothetical protein